MNDFDETLPGQFEYDVKRLAASIGVGARHNGFSKTDTRAATSASAPAYREAMAEFAEMGAMDVWYARLSGEDLLTSVRAARTKKEQGGAAARRHPQVDKARTRDSLQALSKLAEMVDGRYRIVSQPPIVLPARDLAATYGLSGDEIGACVHEQHRAYRPTLQDDRRHLLERFEVVDVALKVVGVGSVGTRAFIVLLQGRDERDRSSCRSRKRPPRCSRATCRRAAIASPARASCTGSG